MIEKNDYVIYQDNIVKILDSRIIRGRLRYKISNNPGWFKSSEFSEIMATKSNYWIPYDILEDEYKSNGNSDFLILLSLSAEDNAWVDNESNISVTSYQEFKDLCRQNKAHVLQAAVRKAPHSVGTGEITEEE